MDRGDHVVCPGMYSGHFRDAVSDQLLLIPRLVPSDCFLTCTMYFLMHHLISHRPIGIFSLGALKVLNPEFVELILPNQGRKFIHT